MKQSKSAHPIGRKKLNQFARAIGILMSENPDEAFAQQTKNLPIVGFGGRQQDAFLKDCQSQRSVDENSAFAIIVDLLSLGVLGYSSVDEKGRHYAQNDPAFNHPSLWLRSSILPVVEPTLRSILFARIGAVKELQKIYAFKNKDGETKEPNFGGAIKASMFGGNANALDNFFGYVYQFKELPKEELVIAFRLGDVPAERVDALYQKLQNFERPAFLAEENFRATRNQLVAMIASWMSKNLEVIESIIATKRTQTDESKKAFKLAKKNKQPVPSPIYYEEVEFTAVPIPEKLPAHILKRKAGMFSWDDFVASINQYNELLERAQAGLFALRDHGTPLSEDVQNAIYTLRDVGEEMLSGFGIVNGELKVEIAHLQKTTEIGTSIEKILKKYPEFALRAVPTLVPRFSREIEKADENARRIAQNAEYEQVKADIEAQTAHLDLDNMVWNTERLDGFIRELLQLPDAYKGIVVNALGNKVVRMDDIRHKAFGKPLYYKDKKIVKIYTKTNRYVYFGQDGAPYYFDTNELVTPVDGKPVNDFIAHPTFANEKKARRAGFFDRKEQTDEYGRWFKHEYSTSRFEPFPILSFVFDAKSLLEQLLAKASSESIGTEGKVLKIIATTKSYLLEDPQERKRLNEEASALTKASSLYSYETKTAFTFRENHTCFYQADGQLGVAIRTKKELSTPVPENAIVCDSTGQRIDTQRNTNFAYYPFTSMHPSYLEPVQALLNGDKRVQSKGATLLIQNLGTPFQRVLVQVPFIDRRINSMKLDFKHLIGIDMNMHNLAYAVINPSESDENGNPVVVANGLIDCQAAQQLHEAGVRYKRKKQASNAMRANAQTREPNKRHQHDKFKKVNTGLIVGHILRLMYQYRALPIFETGIGGLQKNKQMEALWNDVVTSFAGGALDADIGRRNATLGVTLGKGIGFNFFPKLAGSAQLAQDKKTGAIRWTKCKLKPGMTTRHEYTSQRCIHCEIAVTEQIKDAKEIVIEDNHNITLAFESGANVRVHFETSLAKLGKKSGEILRSELRKLAKKQMRTKFEESESTDSRYARFRCFNRDCDHSFETTGHFEHADKAAAINIARNGYQELMTPFAKKEDEKA